MRKVFFMVPIAFSLKKPEVQRREDLEQLDPQIEEVQFGQELESRSFSIEDSDVMHALWGRASSWSVFLPGGVHVYRALSLSNTGGLDLKVITSFILTTFLFRSYSARHKEELQKARAIERAVIRAEYRARVHHAFQNKREQIAQEEIAFHAHQSSSTKVAKNPFLVVGTGAVMAQSGLSVYPIFQFLNESKLTCFACA